MDPNLQIVRAGDKSEIQHGPARGERVLEHGPPYDPCLVCGHAAYSHRGTEPHACNVAICACAGLKLTLTVGRLEQCCQCLCALDMHLAPTYKCVTEGCRCGQYRSPAHPKAKNIRSLFEHRAKVESGEVPPTVSSGPRSTDALSECLGRSPLVDNEIKKVVNDYIRRTIDELGGPEALTAGQQAMLLGQRVNLEVILLAEREIAAQNKVVEANGEALATIRTLQGSLTSFRHGQVALGLARPRRAKKDPTLGDVMEEYKQKAGK